MANIELKYKNTSVVTDDQVQSCFISLKDYLAHLNDVARANNYEFDESTINLPFDEDILNKVQEVVNEKKTKNLKYIIVIGIGGSNLGTQAIYEAVKGKFDAYKKNFPKILFLDTDSSSALVDVKEIIEKQVKSENELLINIISKSGTNTEPIVNFEALYNYLKNKFKNIDDRIVITTGEGSKLWEQAEKKGLTLLGIPEKVGGRFSVFSNVGILPLSFAGINVKKLFTGAKDMRDRCLKTEDSQNIAIVSACLIYRHFEKDIKINNNFFFNPQLESIGKWYRQLMGESIGKEYDVHNKKINMGITPIVSIGSTDLHSMAQLYLGGPNNMFTNFVYTHESSVDAKVPTDEIFPNLVNGIKGKYLSEVMSAILEGVKKAYQNQKIPYMEVVMPEISEYTLGQYLQFKMMEMMFLAKLLGVNAFDQPNVEAYKNETRKILES